MGTASGGWTAADGAAAGSYDGRVSDIDDVPADLARLRSSIDNIDAALIHLLAERFKCTQAVGELKAARGMPPADPAREVAQVARLRALADEAGLDPQFAEAFLNFIIAEVIHHHERIAGGERERATCTHAHPAPRPPQRVTGTTEARRRPGHPARRG